MMLAILHVGYPPCSLASILASVPFGIYFHASFIQFIFSSLTFVAWCDVSCVLCSLLVFEMSGMVNAMQRSNDEISGMVNAMQQSNDEISGMVNAMQRSNDEMSGMVNAMQSSNDELSGMLMQCRGSIMRIVEWLMQCNGPMMR